MRYIGLNPKSTGEGKRQSASGSSSDVREQGFVRVWPCRDQARGQSGRGWSSLGAAHIDRHDTHTEQLARNIRSRVLIALAETYSDVRSCDLGTLQGVVARFGAGPSSFVASGGMLAVATLAAQLHEIACQEPAAAMTPLSIISRPALTSAAAMLSPPAASTRTRVRSCAG